MQFSIVSLTPASGWFAVSQSDEYYPLVGWAVIAYMNAQGEVTEEKIHGMIFHDGLFIRAEMHGEFDHFVRDPWRDKLPPELLAREVDWARLTEILRVEYHLKDKDIDGHLANAKFKLLVQAIVQEDVARLIEEVTI
jgi:hypothetical protein